MAKEVPFIYIYSQSTMCQIMAVPLYAKVSKTKSLLSIFGDKRILFLFLNAYPLIMITTIRTIRTIAIAEATIFSVHLSFPWQSQFFFIMCVCRCVHTGVYVYKIQGTGLDFNSQDLVPSARSGEKKKKPQQILGKLEQVTWAPCFCFLLNDDFFNNSSQRSCPLDLFAHYALLMS